MRLVRFRKEDAPPRIGVSLPDESSIIDLQVAGNDLDVGIPETMQSLLAERRWREKVHLLTTHAREDDVGWHERGSIEILAPLTAPQKIICVGLNYVEHIEETNETRPDNPVLFSKYPTAITGPNTPIAWDPELTSEVDYEVEMAAVIGKEARRIDEDDAREHIAGYTVANDVSARDLQFSDEQWVRGKTLDSFCPLGPAIVTEDELGDPEDLSLWARLNGERVQESTTSNLIFGLDELVSFCSAAFTLMPGDLILTGTPPGAGAFRDPPLLLDDDSEITVGVEGIGEVTNRCQFE